MVRFDPPRNLCGRLLATSTTKRIFCCYPRLAYRQISSRSCGRTRRRQWLSSELALEIARVIDERESVLRIVEAQEMLGGRFHSVRRIDPIGGGGCFSVVFTACEPSGEEVIVKLFLAPSIRDDAAYRWESFQRESVLLAKYGDRDHVVRLIAPQADLTYTLRSDTGIEFPSSKSYYVMEKASGNVGTAIQLRRWSTAESLDAFAGMCRAVQHLHLHNVAHRDLKPDNFLLFPRGVIKLGDLGTGRDLATAPLLPRYDRPVGDLRYTSPELIACVHDFDPQVAKQGDFYALGAILFELVTGVQLHAFVYDHQFVTDLLSHMVQVHPRERGKVFFEIVSSISDAHPLPALRDVSDQVPRCIARQADALYRSLCEFDYRRRLDSFDSVFRQIDICRIILRNEVAYHTWLERRRKWRSASSVA
jgi:serine/threonine protein kinase